MTKITMKKEEGEELDFNKMWDIWYLIEYIYNGNVYVATTKIIDGNKILVYFDYEGILNVCNFTDQLKQDYRIVSEVSEINFRYK